MALTRTKISPLFLVAEFVNKICLIKEHAAVQLLAAVETFRKKANETKKDRYLIKKIKCTCQLKLNFEYETSKPLTVSSGVRQSKITKPPVGRII